MDTIEAGASAASPLAALAPSLTAYQGMTDRELLELVAAQQAELIGLIAGLAATATQFAGVFEKGGIGGLLGLIGGR